MRPISFPQLNCIFALLKIERKKKYTGKYKNFDCKFVCSNLFQFEPRVPILHVLNIDILYLTMLFYNLV